MARAAIWVRIRTPDQGWSGRLVPGRPDLVRVRFFPDGGPARLPLRTPVQLGFARRGMSSAVLDHGRLVHVDYRREDGLECVFEMADPEQLQGQVQGAVARVPDPRRFTRAQPDAGEEVPVRVTLPNAPTAAQRLVGRLLDGGAGGVGLAFPFVAETRLCEASRLRAWIPLPGHQGTGEWVCEVRYRSLMEDGRVRYGLQFVCDGAVVDPPGPQLEALWDCVCGTRALLADTHVHCPVCGATQCGEPRRPSWRDRATAESHPLCGTERECAVCGVSHGVGAQYCGHCGVILPEARTLV